jgi:hypothetical protein
MNYDSKMMRKATVIINLEENFPSFFAAEIRKERKSTPAQHVTVTERPEFSY